MYLINYFLEQFKGTLYRQTMFAEFEKITHEMAWNKEPLTAEVLCDIYYKLNQKYFGEDIVIDKEIALEWARIPHLCISICNWLFSSDCNQQKDFKWR